MSEYLKNYWSLYVEFIETFREVTYRDIPIAMVTNFYQHIDAELKGKMEESDFKNSLMNKGFIEKKDIQTYFDGILKGLSKPIIKDLPGKKLINLDYIRLSGEILNANFDKSNTIVLSRSKINEYYGFPCICLSDYQNRSSGMAKKLVERTNQIFEENKNHPAFSNTNFMNIYIQRIPIICETIDKVFQLYESNLINCVVVGTTEDVLSRCLAILGLLNGIPSLCLQHGILMGEEAFMPVFTRLVGVYGEYEKKWYLTRGLPEGRVEIIGHPRYDDIPKHTNEKIRQKILREFNLAPNKFTFLIATGPNINPLKFICLMEKLLEIKDLQFIIKPHPWEISKSKLSLYSSINSKNKSIYLVRDKKTNLRELFHAIDGVISTQSTVALEGLLALKPVFIFDFLESNRIYDYYYSMDKYFQNDPLKLVEVIEEYLISPDERDFFTNIRNQFLNTSYSINHSGKKIVEFLRNNKP